MTDCWLLVSPCVCVCQERMQQIMMQCFCAVKSKLDRRLGLFDLIGCDFMVDEDFKVGGPLPYSTSQSWSALNMCVAVSPAGVAAGDEL